MSTCFLAFWDPSSIHYAFFLFKKDSLTNKHKIRRSNWDHFELNELPTNKKLLRTKGLISVISVTPGGIIVICVCPGLWSTSYPPPPKYLCPPPILVLVNVCVSRTLISGDKKAGFTVFWADDGLDTGPILLQRECAVEPNDTVDTLYNRFLFPEGIKAMVTASYSSVATPINTPQASVSDSTWFPGAGEVGAAHC